MFMVGLVGIVVLILIYIPEKKKIPKIFLKISKTEMEVVYILYIQNLVESKTND